MNECANFAGNRGLSPIVPLWETVVCPLSRYNPMKKESKSMIALHFDGSFIKEHSLSARTLGHALTAIQRMVDKAVIFEKRGSIKKGDVLPAVWYPKADLIVQPFKKGCVTVPLSGLEDVDVIGRLKGLLHDPYEQAISDVPIERQSLVDGIPAAVNRANYKIQTTSHEQLIQDAPAREQRFFSEAIFRDFDNFISPLRSSVITETDLISIELIDDKGTLEYEFNQLTSKRCHKIVSAKQLGPTVNYSGRLTEFGETKSRDFPYSGRFFSKASGHEHKLLINNEDDADRLRSYNTAKNKELNFFGSPVSAWGAFDEQKGDIVFLKLLSE